MITKNDITALLENTDESFAESGFAKLFALLKEAKTVGDGADSTQKRAAEFADKLINELRVCTSAVISALLQGSTEGISVTERDYALFVGSVYRVCISTAFMKISHKKRYSLYGVAESIRNTYDTELVQPYSVLYKTGTSHIDWVEESSLWKVCVQNMACLLYPNLREIETETEKVAEKGPFEHFVEKLKGNTTLYRKLQDLLNDKVKTSCRDWIKRKPIGVMYLQGMNVQVKTLQSDQTGMRFVDADLQENLYPNIKEQLLSLCCVLDEYGVTEYGEALKYTNNSVTVNVELDTPSAMLPQTGFVYLPALQIYLRNGIGIKITENQKQDGTWGYGIGRTAIKDMEMLCDVMFHLFLFALYNANKADNQLIPWSEFDACATAVAVRSLADNKAKEFLRLYGTSLFYGYSIYAATDAQVDYAANFGAFVVKNNIKSLTAFMKETIAGTEGTESRAKVWFDKEMSQMEILPDVATSLALRGNYIFDVSVYYQKADFGYEANHRLYRNGLAKNSPLCIAKKLRGGDFTLNLMSQDVGGLAIIAGSRSGKGVCTNNIVGNLLARGHSIAYIDGKPEQALALWAFEKTFNEHFKDKLQRPLRLIVVDPMYPLIDESMSNVLATGELLQMADGSESELELDVPTIESEINTPPRVCRVYNLPEFCTSEDFKQFRRENRGLDVLERPYFFNYIRVMKVLHLLLAYAQMKSQRGGAAYRTISAQCQQVYGRPLNAEYAFVAWDELNRWNVNFAPQIAKLYTLINYLTTEVGRLEKAVAGQTEKRKQQQPEQCAAESNKLKQFKKYKAYFERMRDCYAIYAADGHGVADQDDKKKNCVSDIVRGFQGFKTDTKTSNVRFITIMQSISTKTDNFMPCNLFELMQSWKLIFGKNYKGGVQGANPFILENAANWHQESIQKQCGLATDGTLSSLFDGAEGEVSGYFTYRDSAGSNIEVIKTYLTLLDNDYVENSDTHAAPEGGGTYNSSNGGAAVANLLSRTSSNLRDYVLKHDVYSDYDSRVLNAELGFGGATEWLIMQAAHNDYEQLQKLVDGMNMLYDDLLIYVNYYTKLHGREPYAKLEDYFADMSYDAMFTFDNSGVLSAPTKMAGLSIDCPEETEEVSSGPNYGNYDNIEFTGTDFGEFGNAEQQEISKPQADANTTAFEQRNTMGEPIDAEFDEVLDTTEDTHYDTDNFTDDTAESDEDLNDFVNQKLNEPVGRQEPVHKPMQTSQPMPNMRKPVNPMGMNATQSYTAPMETSGDMYSIAVTEDVSMAGLYGRDKLTKALLKVILKFVGGDYSLITSFKIDDIGHIYINDVMIAPQLSADMLADVPPLLQRAVKRNSWSEMFDCRKIYLFKNLQYLEIAGNRSVSAGREIGVGNNWAMLLQPRAKRKYFPALETVIINGMRIGAEETTATRAYDACANVADSFKSQLGLGGVADKIWHKGPLKTCVKALGYGVGLKAFWGIAALLGPVGLLAAGVGTAAVAMKEYDKFQAERQEIRGNSGTSNKKTDTMFNDTDDEMETSKKKKSRSKK